MDKYENKLRLAKEAIESGSYDRKTIEYIFPELKESEDEKIRKEIIEVFKKLGDGIIPSPIGFANIFTWLEKQGEKKPVDMIQWKGNNLKEVIDFTGKCKNFDKWFKSFEEYEKYIQEHGNVFKMFNEDGSHFEVPTGAWIVRTPDGYNVASKAIFKQNLNPYENISQRVDRSQQIPIVSIAEINGEQYVRVCVGDEDFLIAAHDYKEGNRKKFTWDDAMERLKEVGKITFGKHQAYFIAAFKDEINKKLKEIDGDPLEDYSWISTEENPDYAWYVYFRYGFINYFQKSNTCTVRPIVVL